MISVLIATFEGRRNLPITSTEVERNHYNLNGKYVVEDGKDLVKERQPETN